jgi:hypothetical protein
MQEYRLFETVLSLIALLASLLFMYIIIERYRYASGKEIFTDKLINHLEYIHNKTAPKSNETIDIREYNMTDRLKIVELYLHENSSDKDRLVNK